MIKAIHIKGAADLRQDQLVEIAAELIESEGIDAVKHSRIASLAGCTRSLVYHYFPKRADIFAAISARFYAALDELMSKDEQRVALRKNLEGVKDPSLLLFNIMFDLLDKGHWAALILRTTPELSTDFGTYVDSVHDEYDLRWTSVFADRFNLSAVDSAILLENTINVTRTLFLFYRKGLLSRDDAVQKLDDTVNHLLTPYR